MRRDRPRGGCDASVGIGEHVGDDGAALDFLHRCGHQVVDDPRCGLVGRLMLARPHGDEKANDSAIYMMAEVRRCARVEGTVDVGSAQAAICRMLDFMVSLVEALYNREPRDWIHGALWEGHHDYKRGLFHGAMHVDMLESSCVDWEAMGPTATYDDDIPSSLNRLSRHCAHRRRSASARS